MKATEAQSRISDLLKRTVDKDPLIRNAYLLVHSARLGIHSHLAAGSENNPPVHAEQPYYIASVSKLFASVLCGRLADRGLIDFEDPIARFLDAELLRGLHVYKGRDRTSEILVRHLLNHTSGLHDFVEDKPAEGPSMINITLNEPSRLWQSPRELVEWAKPRLKTHFTPGQGFHYSDTGYHLLGLIMEQVTGKPYHELLRHFLFEPLGMKHSYLSRYSEPMEPNVHPMGRLYSRNTDITQYDSLSFMYAGGGLVSTTEDQLKFMKALVGNEILSRGTFERMKDWARFFPGIDYGYGLMRFKPMFLLMPGKYSSWGNAGSTGSFLFYHPATDAYLIGSLNQFRYNRKGIKLMFKAIDILLQCDRARAREKTAE